MSASNRLDPHIRTAVAEVIADLNGALCRYLELYRDKFVWWARPRFPYSDADYEDAFIEALTVFWEKVDVYKRKEPFCRLKFENPEEHLTCDCEPDKEVCKLIRYDCLLKTYLFAVGYRKLLKKNPAKSKLKFPERMPDPPDFDCILLELEEEEKEHAQTLERLMKSFEKMSDICRHLLWLYFFEEKKIPEITEILGYANDNVTRVQKFRCLDRLKDLFNG